MPGKPKGPKTVVQHIRFEEKDYKTLQSCWLRRNPNECHTFPAWLRNELHKLAEECRGTERFPPTVVMMREDCGAAAVDAAGALAAILEIDREKAADLLRRKRVLWGNVDRLGD